MRSRRGFTLLEVLVALVITGLVVSLAYASAQAGFDTGDRLERHRSAGEAEVTARALLVDALRHAVPGVRGGPPVFELADRAGAQGDSLAFLSRGIIPPLGTSSTWLVSLSAGPSGLVLRAREADGAAAVTAELLGITALDVRVLGRGSLVAWSDEWNETGAAPQAVSLAFHSASGATVGTPIVVRLGLERTP